MLGSVTRKKVCQPLAPSTIAASSSSVPCSCISGISSRATKGAVTKVVASTMPGTAKMILMSCSTSQAPNQPWAPKSSTKIMPEITGETANGRSIRVISRFLPRELELGDAPGGGHAEDEVERHRDRGDQQGQLGRAERVGLRDRLPVGRESLGERLGEDQRQRQQQHQRQEDQRDADQGPAHHRRLAGGAGDRAGRGRGGAGDGGGGHGSGRRAAPGRPLEQVDREQQRRTRRPASPARPRSPRRSRTAPAW